MGGVIVADISVDRKSISAYLQSGAKHLFLIPDYQRPYSWGSDEVQTLWDDVTHAFEENRDEEYFCGTVVTFQNDQNQNEIIDGQQRTTTLLLLLRAIYHKLETASEQDDRTAGLMRQIDPCIWKVDPITQKPDKENILISSRVASDENNETFLRILRVGELSDSKDQYSQNYRMLYDLVNSQAGDSPIAFFDLVVYILNKVIVLPIECTNQDTALTIFSTLNDRGMPLNDADIFKAKLFNHNPPEYRDEFIRNWKELGETASDANMTVQSFFTIYMFYLRAVQGDSATTTPGVRKYFQKDQFAKLFEPEVMNDLLKLAGLWRSFTVLRADEDYPFTIDIFKCIQIFQAYTNDWWKYSVSIYYLVHHKEPKFLENFNGFLRNLIAYFTARLVLNPNLTQVKARFLELNVNIVKSDQPEFRSITQESWNQIGDIIEHHIEQYTRSNRMLLTILAYLDPNQTELLPLNLDIEHILPKRWTSANLFGYDESKVQAELENIGNKILLEKRTNIQAGNNSFYRKRTDHYRKSHIANVKKLAKLKKNDWTPEDIRKRNSSIRWKLMNAFTQWGLKITETTSVN